MPPSLATHIDETPWQRLNKQLAELATAIEAGFDPEPEKLDERLRARAVQLAQSEAVGTEAECIEVLAFSCGDEIYAVEIGHLGEVVPLRHYTAVPGTPEFVLGIVSIRGRVVSVVDVGVFFELPRRGLSDLNYLVVLQDQEQEFGLLTDRLLGLHRVNRNQLHTELPNLTGIRASFLLGVTPLQWSVLDGSRLLAAPALRVDQGNRT